MHFESAHTSMVSGSFQMIVTSDCSFARRSSGIWRQRQSLRFCHALHDSSVDLYGQPPDDVWQRALV